MIQRSATEYIKASLVLKEHDLTRLEQWFAEYGAACLSEPSDGQQRTLEFRLDGRESLMLHFRRTDGLFVSEGSYRFRTQSMADMMRRALSAFKGDGVVSRMYTDCAIVCIYERGSVVKIVESRGWDRRVIYDYHNLAGQLEQIYAANRVEREIAIARHAINALLDRRLAAKEEEELADIDRELSEWRHRLFVLEA
jgi:hypothetical protein